MSASMCNSELIKQYQASRQSLARTRAFIAMIIFGSILSFAWLSWQTVRTFSENAPQQISQTFIEQFSRDWPRYQKLITSAGDRLVPAYAHALQSQLEKDRSSLQAMGDREVKSLNQHIESKWSTLEKEIDSLALAQAAALYDEVDKIFDKKVQAKIKEAYGPAIVETFDKFLNEYFKKHLIIGEELGKNLHLLSEAEPDIRSPIDANEAIGLLLELVGVELQEAAVK